MFKPPIIPVSAPLTPSAMLAKPWVMMRGLGKTGPIRPSICPGMPQPRESYQDVRGNQGVADLTGAQPGP